MRGLNFSDNVLTLSIAWVDALTMKPLDRCELELCKSVCRITLEDLEET